MPSKKPVKKVKHLRPLLRWFARADGPGRTYDVGVTSGLPGEYNVFDKVCMDRSGYSVVGKRLCWYAGRFSLTEIGKYASLEEAKAAAEVDFMERFPLIALATRNGKGDRRKSTKRIKVVKKWLLPMKDLGSPHPGVLEDYEIRLPDSGVYSIRKEISARTRQQEINVWYSDPSSPWLYAFLGRFESIDEARSFVESSFMENYPLIALGMT